MTKIKPIPFTPRPAVLNGPKVIKPAPQHGEVDVATIARSIDPDRFKEQVQRAIDRSKFVAR